MKKLIPFILLFVSYAVHAQDSTKIKLEQYRGWKEAGVISDEDYEKMKAKLLGLPTETQPIIKEETVSAPPPSAEKYKAKITAGSIFFGVGLGFVTGGVLFNRFAKVEPAANLQGTIGLTVIGALAATIGGVLLGIGERDKGRVMRAKGRALIPVATDNTVGIAYVF